MALRDLLSRLLRLAPRIKDTRAKSRDPALHVIILDGTMSSLQPGRETNAGKTFKLLREAGRAANLTLYYEAGIQWKDWSGTLDVTTGRGINLQIERAYGVLASRYRPGDRIVLMGYSRGAYAVRSLAGVVGTVGLVRTDQANVRNIRQAYRHYRNGGQSQAAAAFHRAYCHDSTVIEAVAVWDTVKALGMRLPIIWRLAEPRHELLDQTLGATVRHGYHALALDETREAFAPVIWNTPLGFDGQIEQVWFRGTHGDVGGQIGDFTEARPLANIPLVWMLQKLAALDVPLPQGWQSRFEQDVNAPSVGTWHGWGKVFLSRRRRIVGRDDSEYIHPSVPREGRAARLPLPVAGAGAGAGQARAQGLDPAS